MCQAGALPRLRAPPAHSKKPATLGWPAFFVFRYVLNTACGLFLFKSGFVRTAKGTYPISRDIFPLRARSNAIIRIACFRIINITANCAYILFHSPNSFRFCNVKRCRRLLFCCQIRRAAEAAHAGLHKNRRKSFVDLQDVHDVHVLRNFLCHFSYLFSLNHLSIIDDKYRLQCDSFH